RTEKSPSGELVHGLIARRPVEHGLEYRLSEKAAFRSGHAAETSAQVLAQGSGDRCERSEERVHRPVRKLFDDRGKVLLHMPIQQRRPFGCQLLAHALLSPGAEPHTRKSCRRHPRTMWAPGWPESATDRSQGEKVCAR